MYTSALHTNTGALEDHQQQVGAVFVRNWPKIFTEISLIKAHLIFCILYSSPNCREKRPLLLVKLIKTPRVQETL